MTRRIPFNPRQFLNSVLPTSAYRFDMDNTPEGKDFSQGWFGVRTSPAALIVTPKNKLSFERYLINWHKFIENLADSIGMGLILSSDETKAEFGISEKDPRLEIYANKSIQTLDARSFFEDFKIEREQLNKTLEEEYHFDFAKCVGEIKQLLHSLRKSEIGNISHASREIIKRGPETLANSQKVHKAIEAWLINSAVESSHNYPDMATSINTSLDYIIDDLASRIKAATPQNPGRKVI